MAIFMGEYTHAAILRLDGVLANPVVALTDLNAAKLVKVWTSDPNITIARIPAMAPDSLSTQRAAASFFALSRMHRLEGIDVTIGLIEITITIIVITITGVERAQVLIDL